jgi:hypothetical protein
MIGSFYKDNILFPTTLCSKFNGVAGANGVSGSYANQQCKLGLYKKKDLPDGKFVMPGSNTAAPDGLTKVAYHQSFALPMGDCRKMGGVWNGGTDNRTDASPVDCHLTWYTNMA